MFNFPEGLRIDHFIYASENQIEIKELKSLIWQYIEDNSAYEDIFKSKRLVDILCDELYESQKVTMHPSEIKVLVAEIIKEQLIQMGYMI
jgi:hypothetical protein